MTVENVVNYLDKKIRTNEDKVTITFYEARIKLNLSKEETDIFLSLCKSSLEKWNYKVFFTGEEFTYKEVTGIVQDNELLVAIKE